MLSIDECDGQRQMRLLTEFDHLSQWDLPLFPVDGKVPVGRWVHGPTNYVQTPMTRSQAETRVIDPHVQGWAILCGNRGIKVGTLDVEFAGMQHPAIQSVLNLIPDHAKRPSPSGGAHAIFIVTDGDAVSTDDLARRDGVLLAEIRGVSKNEHNHGAYAVVTGPGRGPLDSSFEPWLVTRAGLDPLLDQIRALNQPRETEIRIAANKSKKEYHGTGVRSGTGGCISQALEEGVLTWIDVLDPGWTVVAQTPDTTGLLRPSFADGDQPKSNVSANAWNNVLVVHSSSVPWSDSCETFNPPQAFAAAHFEADFAAAMSAVEQAAEAWVESRQTPEGIFANWPASFFEGVYTARKKVQRDFMAQQDDAGGAPRTRLRVFGRHDLRHLPQPEPLIERTLDRSTVALLAGPPSSYKSFVALDWACSIATGSPWHGRNTEPGRVVFIAGEGTYGLNNRVCAWESHHQLTVPHENLTVVSQPVQLHNSRELDDLMQEIDSQPVALVVIDTLARCAVGLDENAAKDMGVVIDAVTRLRDSTDRGTVLLVHHTGKDGKTIRGSSALEGAADTVYLARAQSKPHLILERRKRKDGPEADVVHLAATEDVSHPSLVLVSNGASKVTDNQQLIVSNLQSKPQGAAVTASTLQKETGLSKSSVHYALNHLEGSGQIRKKTNTRPFHYCLAVAEG